MAGLADYAQAALGKPVRIGRPPHLKGLPEAHAVPGFATLAGLVLYAAEDPVDIRAVGPRHQITRRYGATAMAQRLWHAMKEYF
jgi:cell division protein FtsA